MTNDPLASAQEHRELTRKHRDTTEADRKWAEQIVEALIETGLCRMALPAANGRLKTSPLEAALAV